jgi:Mg-chelatase subunit ChlD
MTWTVGLILAGLCVCAPRAEAQGVTNFTINVPTRTLPLGNDGVLNTPDDQLPIARMEVRVTMATADPVAFRILDPFGEAKRFPANGEMSAGVADPPEAVYAFVPPGGTAGDRVIVHPPAFGNAPQDRVYTIFIETRSDYNAATCSSLMAAAETWSIVVEGPVNPRISGVCLLGFDLAFPNQQCQQPRLIPIVTPPTPLASVPGFPTGSSQLCATARPGVDALLVLDKSGSMASPALGTTPRTKIAALHAAVQDLVDVWTALRASEGANAPNDRLGLVFFDTAAKWASQVGVAAWSGLSQGLDTFNTNLRNLIFNNVTQVPASGATAMGQGLLKADNVFTTNTGNRKVVLLMSDGIQNVDPMIGVDSFVTPTKLNTYNQATPNNTTLVPHQANYQTYAVTIGTSSAVSAAINMAVARARNGFTSTPRTTRTSRGRSFSSCCRTSCTSTATKSRGWCPRACRARRFRRRSRCRAPRA